MQKGDKLTNGKQSEYTIVREREGRDGYPEFWLQGDWGATFGPLSEDEINERGYNKLTGGKGNV